MASIPLDPKHDESSQSTGKSDGANKGTSSGGTPGGKLPNDKSPQGGSAKSAGEHK